MDTLGLIAAFRTDVDDNVAPFLWSSETVAEYADDAQKMFCRLTNGIADASSQLCEIDISAGEAFAPTDKRILKIRSIVRGSDGRSINVFNIEDAADAGLRLDGRFGPVHAVVIGMEDHKLRWVNVPAVDDVARLVVYRLPMRAITTTKAPLEIDEQHHRALLLWMKHLAYGRQDSDTYDSAKSGEAEVRFRTYCKAAKAEQDRAKYKVRITAYGGV